MFDMDYWDDRFLDIMLIFMQCANLLMNFGITKSIHKAYQAELKKREMMKLKIFNSEAETNPTGKSGIHSHLSINQPDNSTLSDNEKSLKYIPLPKQPH